jgi:hypothetical protein
MVNKSICREIRKKHPRLLDVSNKLLGCDHVGKRFVLDDHANHSAKPAMLHNPTSRDPKGWVGYVS